MASRSGVKKQWEGFFEYLKGRTIKDVKYMEDKNNMNWDRTCLMIILDDGTAFYPSADDEGNGAGAMFFDPSKEAHESGVPLCAPVI